MTARKRRLTESAVASLRGGLFAKTKQERTGALGRLKRLSLDDYARVMDGVSVATSRGRSPGSVSVKWEADGWRAMTEAFVLALVGGPRGAEPAWAKRRRLQSIRVLNLSCTIGLVDLRHLAPLGRLRSLQVRRCPSLRRLDGVSSLSELTHLDCFECPKLDDFTALRGHPTIQSIDLTGCRKAVELGPLEDLPALKSVDLRGLGLNWSAFSAEFLDRVNTTIFEFPDLRRRHRLVDWNRHRRFPLAFEGIDSHDVLVVPTQHDPFTVFVATGSREWVIQDGPADVAYWSTPGFRQPMEEPDFRGHRFELLQSPEADDLSWRWRFYRGTRDGVEVAAS